jgi:glycosyltransferase involved in cell wall biosynthesis
MAPVKIAAYAITKNEQSNVQRFYEQTRMFDHVTVLDTGSTDQTVHMLRDKGITVHELHMLNFDFSEARNMCMSLTPPDMDWLMVLDMNDHFEPLPDLRSQLTQVDAHAASVNYLSSEDPNYCEHKIRLHRPLCYTWKKAVHEYLVPVNKQYKRAHVEWNITKHTSHKQMKHAFYTQICERAHVENPSDPHYSWWALKYYRDVENWHRLKYFCEHYLDHTVAYGVEFRVYAWIYLSECVQPHSWDKSVDFAVHAFSESLTFKHTIPKCVNIAARRLNSLGISMNGSRIVL